MLFVHLDNWKWVSLNYMWYIVYVILFLSIIFSIPPFLQLLHYLFFAIWIIEMFFLLITSDTFSFFNINHTAFFYNHYSTMFLFSFLIKICCFILHVIHFLVLTSAIFSNLQSLQYNSFVHLYNYNMVVLFYTRYTLNAFWY